MSSATTIMRLAAALSVWGLLGAGTTWVADLEAARQSDQTAPERAMVTARTVKEGLTIDFAVSRHDTGAHRDRVLREDDDVEIGFTIRDAGSGSPVPGLNPAAWLALSRPAADEPQASCGDLVRAALGQTVFSRPQVDLNAYYVLALNADATISVIDPLLGFSGTKLLAMIALESPGEDWALTSDQNRLLVSMPAARRVAAIDTRSWSVAANVEVGRTPSRIILQPDEAYAWVATEGGGASDSDSGVTVIDVRTLKVVARIPTGRGPHQMAFSGDSRFAFVTNGGDGTVSIVSVRDLRNIKSVAVGSRVASIAFSRLAQAAFVTSPEDGMVTAIGMTSHDVVARIKATPGVGAIEFGPDGWHAFVTNSAANTLTIVDASRNRIVATVDVDHTPDEIAFSDRFAYVRHANSEIVAMLPLDELKANRPNAALLDFPGGQHVLGSGSRKSLAASIVRPAENNAMLVVNPGDRAIYYYQEGMAAPMGQFSTYGREPVAVRVVDRSLRETRPGRYLSALRLPPAGRYSALLFINSPRIVHCFDLSIDAAPGRAAASEPRSTRLESLTSVTSAEPGKPVSVRVRVLDGSTGTPVRGLRDAGILVMAPGVWQTRQSLDHAGDGVYTTTITLPSPGVYTVFVACPSRRIAYRAVFAVEVAEPGQ